MDAATEVKPNAIKAQGEQNHSNWEVREKCDQRERFHVILTGLERGRKHLEWWSNTGKSQETLRDPMCRYAQGPAGHLVAQVGFQGSWGREKLSK